MQLVCFSHLRWHFVYQRPQHVLSRFAPEWNVFFVEEPLPTDAPQDSYDEEITKEGVTVLVPRLSNTFSGDHTERLRTLVNRIFSDYRIRDFTAWYYTPMALSFTRHLEPALTVFDAMDELSAFKYAPAELLDLETELLSRADVVFTGGQSLYEAKKHRHPQHPRLPKQHRQGAFCAGARPCPQPDGSGPDSASAPRFLWRGG